MRLLNVFLQVNCVKIKSYKYVTLHVDFNDTLFFIKAIVESKAGSQSKTVFNNVHVILKSEV